MHLPTEVLGRLDGEGEVAAGQHEGVRAGHPGEAGGEAGGEEERDEERAIVSSVRVGDVVLVLVVVLAVVVDLNVLGNPRERNRIECV